MCYKLYCALKNVRLIIRMVFSIIKWTLISLTLIFLIHHLYMFLLNTLTVPKIKDLVNKPNEQYRDIFDTLNKNTNKNNNNNVKAHTEQNMTEELSLFLNDLKKKGGENNTVVGGRNPQGAALSNPKGGENKTVVGGQDPIESASNSSTIYSPF